jgi:hypothetical protein
MHAAQLQTGTVRGALQPAEEDRRLEARGAAALNVVAAVPWSAKADLKRETKGGMLENNESRRTI